MAYEYFERLIEHGVIKPSGDNPTAPNSLGRAVKHYWIGIFYMVDDKGNPVAAV